LRASLSLTQGGQPTPLRIGASTSVLDGARSFPLSGLFQGRLGFTKAIVLLEDGCEEFSNIHGLGQILFPKGNIKAACEEIRQVLEREGVLGP